MISIKYNHPLINRFVPTKLELPLYKISFYKLEKTMFFYKIFIGVSSKEKIKIFNYNLGLLRPSGAAKIRQWSEILS